MTSIDRLVQADAVSRLRAHDASLFSSDPAIQAQVSDSMGWTDLAGCATARLSEIEQLDADVCAEGTIDVVLMGMGGSSLAALVMARILMPDEVRLHVLDTVAPRTVQAVLDNTDPATTLHLVSSKSGTTIEPNTLCDIFMARAAEALGAKAAARQFVAITDPGSALEARAAAEGWRATISSPPDVGGRFSALTVFGLVPAVVAGIDVRRVLRSALAMDAACGAAPPDNPGASLAALIADAYAEGRDKLTLVMSPALSAFGLWVEQLVAESLGKQGRGIVPVIARNASEVAELGADRALVVMRYAGDGALTEWSALQGQKRTVGELILNDAWELGGAFVQWEYAIALTGHLLGVNPFDQPNVAQAKDATTAVLSGETTPATPDLAVNGTELTFAGALEPSAHLDRTVATALSHALAEIRPGDYFTLLAFVPDDADLLEPLHAATTAVSLATGAATCVELGPRYLHSTGQLHKGGPNTGVFVMLSTQDEADIDVPGRSWTLRDLHRAQVQGDLSALATLDRRVLHVSIADASPGSVHDFASALTEAAASFRSSAQPVEQSSRGTSR